MLPFQFTDMDGTINPQTVANAFVTNYYKILSDSPQISYKFYKESSLLSWPDFDGNLAPVTTLNAINEKIMSSVFKNFTVEMNTVDAQASQDGGIIIAVTGSLIKDGQVTNIFFQTFFLAKQEKGFFVLNDNLRIFDSFESMTNAAANPLAVQTSGNVSDSSKSPPTEKAAVKKALDNSLDQFSVQVADMGETITPQIVADSFVLRYYKILSDSPQYSYKFYNESSLLSWPDFDGNLAPVTTLNAINEKIMSSDFKNFTMEINTVDAQASQDGGFIVAVTGSLIEDDEVTNIFFQTFFLAKQENGFFVLNDNLRIFDSFGSMTNAAANPLPLQTSEGGNVSDSSKSPPTEKAEIKEALDNSVVPKDSVAKSSSSLSPVTSDEKAVPKVPSIVVPASNASTTPKVPSIVVAVSNANMPPKLSYASMVAKDAPITSPKSATPKSAVVTPSPKAPLKNGIPKSSSKIVSKSPTAGKSEPETKTPPEAKGVFVGSLPYEITEKALRDALKQFGPIRKYSDAVQIRKHNDGFCLAFVEFESADSARRAVEVHHVKFGEKEAYIAQKRSTATGRVRSPTRTGFRNGNGNRSDYEVGRARYSQVGRSSGHGPRRTSRDHPSN
ncbi:nuclear transport factor 2 family protein [Striga asiatica]|uniref:Nuclear transport factor 2 family protein n=1 Tax=Striga asiatica TaxID=4170 RepID=A0A5A7PHS2_STRAF|nr:nuclear transport factor 2 family protein [Striga asiatica]